VSSPAGIYGGGDGRKVAASLLVGIGVGLAVAYWQRVGGEHSGPDFAVESRAPLARRLSAFETSLALERFERQALADELSSLRASMAAPFADRVPELFPDDRPQNPQALDQFLSQQQFDRFVAAGLRSASARS
jgi:hypothetical protein